MSSIVVEPQAAPRGQVFRGQARWGVAALLFGGAALQLLSTLLEPEHPDPVDRVAYWSAHSTRIGISMAVTLLSVPLTIGGIAALVALTKDRSRRLAWGGGATIITALVGLAAVVGLELMAYWITLGGDPGAAAAGLDSDEIGLPGVLLMVLFLGGALVGMVLMAAAMWRSPNLPRIAAVLIAGFVVTDIVVDQPVVGHVLNVAWSAVVAWSVLTGYVRRPKPVAQ
jgi:hypothetical protein